LPFNVNLLTGDTAAGGFSNAGAVLLTAGLNIARSPATFSGPVSYKENQKHLISGIFVYFSHFIAFSAEKTSVESRKRERSESVIKHHF